MRDFIKTSLMIFSSLLVLCSLTLGLTMPAFATSSGDFVITVKTDNTGGSGNTQFIIPTYSGETYNYDVDWDNDGTDDVTGATGNVTCNYAVAGTYTIRIKGTFPRIYFNNTGDIHKIISIDQWGTQAWSSMEKAFYGCDQLVGNAADAPDLTNVTSMSHMFAVARIFNQDIGDWDTGNVTNMYRLFYLAHAFNQDIGSWDVSHVTNMSEMFYYANAFNQAIGGWDVGNVTTMQDMFHHAMAFNQPIGGWDVGSVTTMRWMFYFATAFNQDIGSWDVSHVTDLSGMFIGASAFNQNIGGWDVSNVTTMSALFQGASAFNQNIGSWDVSHVTTMSVMFLGASAFNQNIGGWDVSHVTSMIGMFGSAVVFNQNIGGWDVGNVTTMNGMFEGASAFNQDISGWDVSNVTSMDSMFEDTLAFNQNIGVWDVSSVTTMRKMFEGARVFNQNIGVWDVSHVTDMHAMFAETGAFNQDIGGWNVGHVTGMSWMFHMAGAFDQDLGEWDISSLTDAGSMFYNATLSTANYDSLLIGWESDTIGNGTHQNNVYFHGGDSIYCSSAAQTARALLTGTDGWTIGDGGTNCPLITATPIVTPTATGTHTATPSVTSTPTITPTSTVSATPTPVVIVWQDHFVGTSGVQVTSWEDESDNAAHNAEIAYAATASRAEVTLVSGESWGKVLSPSRSVAVYSYPAVEVSVTGLTANTSWKLGIQETEGSWRYWDISGSMTATGVFAFNYSAVTGLSGTSTLAVVLTIEGGSGATMEMDYVRISDSTGLPTPTPTITPTPGNAYFTHFTGTAGSQPEYWWDETDDSGFNAEVFCVYTASHAAVTRTADSTWGKAQSPILMCDVGVYSYVEFYVSGISSDTSWKVGIQESEGGWNYYDLSGSQTGTGTYEYNFASVAGWTGVHTFRVQLVVEGSAGKSIEMDWLRVGGDETIMGATVDGASCICTPTFTATPTATSTATPTITVTPEATPAADTATPTRTPTMTPTPYVAADTVLPYPNPARGKVNFAYTVSGPGKVKIDIYKLTGERVASIVEQINGGAGQTLSTAWEAADVAPGIYFCRIVITDGSGKVVLDQKKKVALIQ